MRRAVGSWWPGVWIWVRIRSAGLWDVWLVFFFWGRQTGGTPAVRRWEDVGGGR